MRMLRFGMFTLVACFLTANWTEANGLFRRCHTCQTGSPGARNFEATGAKNFEAAPPKAEKIGAPAPLVAPLAIASSGLEAEVQKRIADWAAKGKTPTSTTAGETQTLTVKVGDQTIEITIRVIGGGKPNGKGGVPEKDLVKNVQAAFDTDTVLTGFDKRKIKDNLATAYLVLAAKLRGTDPLVLGTETITKKEGVHRMKEEEILRAAGKKNLPATQKAINQLVVDPLSLKDDTTALTESIRADLATQFERIAAALNAVK